VWCALTVASDAAFFFTGKKTIINTYMDMIKIAIVHRLGKVFNIFQQGVARLNFSNITWHKLNAQFSDR
jgi:CRISPR/Cas system-associated endonuclease Cas3-HD